MAKRKYQHESESRRRRTRAQTMMTARDLAIQRQQCCGTRRRFEAEFYALLKVAEKLLRGGAAVERVDKVESPLDYLALALVINPRDCVSVGAIDHDEEGRAAPALVLARNLGFENPDVEESTTEVLSAAFYEKDLQKLRHVVLDCNIKVFREMTKNRHLSKTREIDPRNLTPHNRQLYYAYMNSPRELVQLRPDNDTGTSIFTLPAVGKVVNNVPSPVQLYDELVRAMGGVSRNTYEEHRERIKSVYAEGVYLSVTVTQHAEVTTFKDGCEADHIGISKLPCWLCSLLLGVTYTHGKLITGWDAGNLTDEELLYMYEMVLDLVMEILRQTTWERIDLTKDECQFNRERYVVRF